MPLSRQQINLLVALSVIAAVYALFSFFTPYGFDDYLFMSVYRDHNGGSEQFSFTAWSGFADELRANDNGRLANILSPISTLFMPKWLFAAIAGTMVAGMMYLATELAGVRKDCRLLALGLFWGVSVVALPWRNTIMVPDYLLNYVFSSFFILLYLKLLFATTGKVYGRTKLILVGVITIIAGCMHEGFSVPVAAALGGYAMLRKFRLTRQWLLLFGLFSLSAIYVAAAPGVYSRMGAESEILTLQMRMKCLLAYTPLALPTLCVVLWKLVWSQNKSFWREEILRERMFVLTATAILTTCMALMVKPTPRVGWMAELFYLILLLRIWREELGSIPRRLRRITTGAIYTVLLVFFGFVIAAQSKFYEEDKVLIAKMKEGPSGTLFYDIIPPEEYSANYLYLPMRYHYVENFNLNCLSRYLGRKCGVVPTALRGISKSALVPIPGNGGLYYYNGELVSLDTSMPRPEAVADTRVYLVETEAGTTTAAALSLNFVGDDGRCYNYIRLPEKGISPHIVKVDKIK